MKTANYFYVILLGIALQSCNEKKLTEVVEVPLLRQGVQVQFVNVNEKIKQKIKEMGLEHVLICS